LINTDVSEEHIGAKFFLDCLILEDETDMFSRNVGNYLGHVRSQKSKALDENQFTYFVPAA